MLHIDDFIQNLFYLANDDDPEVRKNICRAIVMLLEVSVFYLLQSKGNIIPLKINRYARPLNVIFIHFEKYLLG